MAIGNPHHPKGESGWGSRGRSDRAGERQRRDWDPRARTGARPTTILSFAASPLPQSPSGSAAVRGLGLQVAVSRTAPTLTVSKPTGHAPPPISPWFWDPRRPSHLAELHFPESSGHASLSVQPLRNGNVRLLRRQCPDIWAPEVGQQRSVKPLEKRDRGGNENWKFSCKATLRTTSPLVYPFLFRRTLKTGANIAQLSGKCRRRCPKDCGK